MTESPQEARRWVVVLTLVVGTSLLAATLAAPYGGAVFYWLGALAGLTWIGGSLLSGPIRWWDPEDPPFRPLRVITPLVIGAAVFGVFVVVKVVGESVPFVADSVASVLARADAGPRGAVLALALLNGVGEEMFFRGALYSVFERRNPVLWTTAIYCVVTVTTLQFSLVAAALVMGLVFSAERRATKGILASALTHISWSTLVLFLLPR